MTSTLFTAAIIIGTIILFIIFFKSLHKKSVHKKRMKRSAVFEQVAWKNKLEITEREIINLYELAIDKLNFILLYIDHSEDEEKVHLIDIWNVRSVKVTTDDNSVYEQKNGKAVLIDKQVSSVQLEVTLTDNSSTKLVLPIYQYKDGVQDVNSIRQKADHWADVITGCMRELPHAAKHRV